ncbi:helix-turn-helix domain-containing protein [Candidatus Pacearchaeota archaeon]|nr:helix-turn-helix domain-containing protein [Candidatus Pacearchaeota archaeon]
MKPKENLYEKLWDINNLFLAFNNAKKGKTKRRYVKRFQRNINENLFKLQQELITKNYNHCELKTFILRDPKTRKISKSAFRDRVVHHALCNIIVPIFEKSFIYDSHANQIGKGTLKALQRFDEFKRKVSRNNTRECFVLKADIKHYFEEIDHQILIEIIRRKIKDEKVIWLIEKILSVNNKTKGMPLGNLTSQFFANLYLNELDVFVKNKLRAKFYIRYVDDFVILHENKEQLEEWKISINTFLKEKLKIELHPSKSHVLKLSSGINFLGFRVFYHHKLIRASNLKNFDRKFNNLKIIFDEEIIGREKALEFLEGWIAYCSYANTFKYRKHLIRNFNKSFSHGNKLFVHNKRNYINYIKRVGESELQFAVQKTLFNYKNGLTIKEIAIKQGIKDSTVWGHLINLIEHKQLSVLEVLPKEKIYKILNKIYSYKEILRDIKKRLKDDSITYDDIDCVIASIKSKRKFKKKKNVLLPSSELFQGTDHYRYQGGSCHWH